MSETGEPPHEPHSPVSPPPPPPPQWAPPPPLWAPPSTQPAPPPDAAPRRWQGPGPAAPAATHEVPPGLPLAPAPIPPSNRAGVASVLVAMTLLLVATVGSYIYVHNEPTSSSSTVHAVGGSNASGGNGAGRVTASPATPATATPPDPYATPTTPPLDMGAVRRTMEAFLNAFQNHDLQAVRNVVCPKYRSLYKGTYSKGGYSYNGWTAHYQDPVSGLNYTYVVVSQGLTDTTGAKRGSETHAWSVEHDDGEYYVCGYLSE